jgi:hypothetical protein
MNVARVKRSTTHVEPEHWHSIRPLAMKTWVSPTLADVCGQDHEDSKQGSSSFLKKRTKKLLIVGLRDTND